MNEILRLVLEYYTIEKGLHITRYQEELTFFVSSDIQIHITRRALKHVVEQRARDAYSAERIQQLFLDAHAMLHGKTYAEKVNDSEGTLVLVQTEVAEPVGVVLVLELHKRGDVYLIKTGFYRAASKLGKLLQQK